jgi:hypothetical protein
MGGGDIIRACVREELPAGKDGLREGTVPTALMTLYNDIFLQLITLDFSSQVVSQLHDH